MKQVLAIKVLEMLLKKEGTYELGNLKTDLEFDIPEGNDTIPDMKVNVRIEVESLKVTVSNSNK